MKDYEEKLEELGYQFNEEEKCWIKQFENIYLFKVWVDTEHWNIVNGVYAKKKDIVLPNNQHEIDRVFKYLEKDVDEIEQTMKRK